MVLWYDGLRNTGKHASEGDKKKMKKLTKSFLVMILGLLMSVNVMADVQTGKTEPDYPTDYYMIVESKAGGIDIYSQPDLESTRLNDEQIPNGTALHIEGEVEDTENNRTWGYTEYHGMYGYAPLDECRPADSRKADAEGGSQKLYQGPGTKYGEVPGVRDIENGETLHITQDAEMADGSHWGVTTVDGTEGWVDLEKTEEWKKEHPDTVEESVDAVAEVSVTPTEVAKATETPAPTETAEATETPAPTETAKATETPVPTEAAEATETPTPAVTEEADEAENTEKDSKEPEAENSDTKDSREASGQNVKAAKTKWYQNPFTWIIGIAVLAVIGLLVYHNKKK